MAVVEVMIAVFVRGHNNNGMRAVAVAVAVAEWGPLEN